MLRRPPTEREQLAQAIADRLHPAMTALGILFGLVVLGQGLSPPGALETTLAIATWVLWAAFVFEFVLRLVIAPSTPRFLRRNWWQVALLALPFLSFLRMLRVLRVGRAGRIVSAAVRASRTAGQALRSRLLWLATVHAIVVLGTSELLVELEEFGSLARALHQVAISAVVGEPISGGGTFTRVLEVVLAIYSAVVFASLAGAVGAFFLERRREGEAVRERVAG